MGGDNRALFYNLFTLGIVLSLPFLNDVIVI